MTGKLEHQVATSAKDSLISVVKRDDVAIIGLVEESVLVEMIILLALRLPHQLIQVKNKRRRMVVTVLPIQSIHDVDVQVDQIVEEACRLDYQVLLEKIPQLSDASFHLELTN